MNKIIRLVRYDWPLHFLLLLSNWFPDNVACLRFRGWLVKPFFAKCGKNLRLSRNLLFYNPSKIFIGDDVFIAYGTWISARGDITIKDEATIGPYCVMSSSNHLKVGNSFYNEDAIISPIEIGEGCWLGAHCTVTAGCKIGNGSVVGAGAVVVHNIPDNVLATGVPAKPVKEFK